jgi:hypothetical protein
MGSFLPFPLPFLIMTSVSTPLILIQVSKLLTPERYSALCSEVIDKDFVQWVLFGAS